MRSISIVGSGPTAIYTLAALRGSPEPHSITVFEASDVAGEGTPYAPRHNNVAMLSNIASIELPPVTETLLAWIERQPDARLAEWGVAREDIDERAFFPRVTLGAFFREQFEALVGELDGLGHSVHLRTGHRITDAELLPDGVRVFGETGGQAFDQVFDSVVMATGHSWPDRVEPKPGYFTSPWPASALNGIRNCAVGIRGTSLSGIDTVVTIASNHGSFEHDEAGMLRYRPAPGSEGFSATLMSRKGLLPEADFFHPLPYEPLRICTEEAVEALVASRRHGLLDAIFELFAEELAACDPDYAARIGLSTLDVESFAPAYFAVREGVDPFTWAACNLAEAKADQEAECTVPWRYAILRMHEVIALAAPHLSAGDLDRFHKHFKHVFVDDYATVPHQSIERLLALHDAGKIEILKLGSDYHLDTECEEPGARLTLDGETRHFPAFVEAMGQESLTADQLPLPGLLRQGVVRQATAPVHDGSEDRKPVKGIALDEAFRLRFPQPLSNEFYCLALPFLLHQHPFSQGITSSHEMGEIVGAALIEKAQAEAMGPVPIAA
ncbi:MAG: hypothetical protein DI629_06165 [Mesorhizobium amorphae]|nr:MAG: hypothetical protein DI629_06165 [Mesorhizobium amorphae]